MKQITFNSSLVSCFLTMRLHLSHCDFDSRPLFLVPLFLSPYIHTHTYILLVLLCTVFHGTHQTGSGQSHRFYRLLAPVKQKEKKRKKSCLVYRDTYRHLCTNRPGFVFFWSESTLLLTNHEHEDLLLDGTCDPEAEAGSHCCCPLINTHKLRGGVQFFPRHTKCPRSRFRAVWSWP